MNLIFNEYLSFLKDKGINVEEYNLKEGYYWLDNQIIKAYDKEGNLHKILRLYVDEKLNITVKTVYKNKPFEIESWYETVDRNKSKLIQIENESLDLIKNNINSKQEYEPLVFTSEGKDSLIVQYLVNIIKNDTISLFNNTTLDCADTYKLVKEKKNTIIITPKEGFYQWRERLNFIPTQFARACCTIMKEKPTIDYLDKDKKYLIFLGMRSEESSNRSNYTDEWKNEKWGERDWLGILPIRKWTEIDVWLYILWKNLKFNVKYKKGYSRQGCSIACPFYGKSTWVLDQYWYPQMYKRWHDILDKDFTKNNKDIILNCTQEEYHMCWNGGILRSKPTEEVVNEFAERNNLNKDVARKYFNHKCECCDKKIKSKEVLAMNLKYLGRNTNKYFCKKHLMETIGNIRDKPFTEENWTEQVESFKSQGCELF